MQGVDLGRYLRKMGENRSEILSFEEMESEKDRCKKDCHSR